MIPREILISEQQIQARVAEMAAEIRRDFPDEVHLIAVLKGAFIFLSDLVRHVPGKVSLDFMATSSYAKGTTTSGEVKLTKDLDLTLDGRNVIIVEDIVDSGLTLHYLHEILRARNPKTLRTACLLSKPSRRRIDVPVEYIGFTIEDHFVGRVAVVLEAAARALEPLCTDDRSDARDGRQRVRGTRAAAALRRLARAHRLHRRRA